MSRGLLVVVPLVAIGAPATVVALGARESDPQFVLRQEHPQTIEPRQVGRLLQKAPEPVAHGKGGAAVGGTCKPGKRDGDRRNPWRCRVRYESGRRITYRVTIDPKGAIDAADRTGAYTVQGCCLPLRRPD
jgi:hypothetical protein